MDDRMDELLGELALDPEDTADPWRRPVRLLIWGILLSTVTLNFWNLDMLLPGVGLILMYLGLRALRRENRGFRAAWALAIGRFLFTAAVDCFAATPFERADVLAALYIPSAALQIVQLLALRAGFAGVFDRAGSERRLRSFNWLIVMQILVAVLGFLNVGSMGIFGAALLGLYIGIIVALFKLPRALGDAGCALRNAPVRLGDLPAAALAGAALLALVAGAYFAGIAMRVPNAELYTPDDSRTLADGLPAEAAELLTPAEAALFEDAVEIQFKSRGPETLPDGTVIEFCTAVAELPEQKLLILHIFRYLEGGPKYGDGFECWHSSHFTRAVRPDTGSPQPTGALVYQRGGETYRAPLRDLRGGHAVIPGVLWNDEGDRITGNVYAPRGAENARGYVLYMVRAQSDSHLIYNLCMNYLHTGLFDSFRRGTAADMLLSNISDSRWTVIHLTDFSSFGREESEPDPENYGFTVNSQPAPRTEPSTHKNEYTLP